MRQRLVRTGCPVVGIPCSDYSESEQAVEQCLTELGVLEQIRPGMRIGVKVNLVSGLAPDRAATTHPALVAALVRVLRRCGASVVVGDSPGGPFTALVLERMYSAAGLKAAAEEGAVLNTDTGILEARYPDGKTLRQFTYTAWLDDVDLLINFSKLKTHAMMAMSNSVKNLYGVIPGTTKLEYHMRFSRTMDFADMLVDLNTYFAPEICLTDAVVGMEGNGPTNGTPRRIGLLLGSCSSFSLDAAAAGLIGLGRADVPTLEAAFRRGLGPNCPEEVAGYGKISAFACPDYAPAARKQSVTFEKDGPIWHVLSRGARWLFETRPVPERNRCIGCGKCRSVCPADAITMNSRLPEIDRNRCIRCFCCSEFCPAGAMKADRNPVGTLIHKLSGSGK